MSTTPNTTLYSVSFTLRTWALSSRPESGSTTPPPFSFSFILSGKLFDLELLPEKCSKTSHIFWGKKFLPNWRVSRVSVCGGRLESLSTVIRRFVSNTKNFLWGNSVTARLKLKTGRSVSTLPTKKKIKRGHPRGLTATFWFLGSDALLDLAGAKQSSLADAIR